MRLFSKKEDTRHIAAFDASLNEVNVLSKKFRDLHFQSLRDFEDNFKKEKTQKDIRKERELFDKHLEVFEKLKFECDVLIDEGLKILRNETTLTTREVSELKKLGRNSTDLKISAKSSKK